MRVVGLDPALSAFGIARVDTMLHPLLHLATVRPQTRGHLRLNRLLTQMLTLCIGADLVVVEGIANYGRAHGTTATDLAGLHWLVRHELWNAHIPYAVVPPSCRQKWITGKGNAAKDECLAAAIKRFPHADISDNNQADALTLAAMGLHHLGHHYVDMPADRAGVLTGTGRKGQPTIQWPERKSPA